MKKQLTRLVLIVAAISIVVTIAMSERREIGNEPGMIAEDFSLPMYEAGQGELSDYEGDVVILNMWASWCEPCRDEMPDLMRLQADYEEQGLTIVTVNMHTYERKATDAPDFIEELDITLPVFFDEDGEVADRYQIVALPTTYIIDRNRVITQVIRGEVHYDGLLDMVEPLF